MIGGLAVVGLAAVVAVVLKLGESAPAQTPAQVNRSIAPPAPSNLPIITATGSSEPIKLEPVPPGTPVPQPPGPTPEGKVWSPEHRHFHDLPGAVAQAPAGTSETIQITPPSGSPGTLTPQPEGPVPEGKVWSPEHGHYHDLPAAGQGPAGANGAIPPTPVPADPIVITPQPVVPPAPPPQESPGPK